MLFRLRWFPSVVCLLHRRNRFDMAALYTQRREFATESYFSVVVVPSSNGDQLERFCDLNKGISPLLFRSTTGDTTAGNLGDLDVRTVLGSYHVLKCGQEVSHVKRLERFQKDNMVTFYIGSISHCIEKLLMNAGILTQGRQNVKQSTPLYKTNIPCEDAGPFSSPVVVALHPIPRNLLEKAIDSTSCLLGVVSALPVHIGDPSLIGINDINQPDFGDPPVLDDSVPVFWGSCVTAHLAVRSAGLPIAFKNDMDHIYVCDTPTEEFLQKHPPIGANTKLKVVTLKEDPFVASLLSENCESRITDLEAAIQEDVGSRGIANLHIPGELLRAALALSHSSSVAVHFGFPCVTGKNFLDETDGPPGAIAIGKALKALGKKVTFIASSYHVQLVETLVSEFLGREVSVVEFKPSRNDDPVGVQTAAVEFLFHDGAKPINPKFDALVAIEATSRTAEGGYMTMKGRDLSDVCRKSPVDELFIQAYNSGKIATIGIGDGGNEIGMGKVRQRVIKHIENGPQIASNITTDHLITASVSNWGGSALAAALFVLSQCPVHSWYARRGVGKEREVSMEDVLNTVDKEEQFLSYICEIGVCDGISPWKKMSVDNLPFDPDHKNKLQNLLTIATSSLPK